MRDKRANDEPVHRGHVRPVFAQGNKFLGEQKFGKESQILSISLARGLGRIPLQADFLKKINDERVIAQWRGLRCGKPT
ncbi:MAG: hypothetical protein M5R36_11980 [Deltaproteobacteria bacterium]|nr:hypothetical protein [Deltaproteobacteria bacterium]